MAIFHLKAQVITRGKGQSAVAAAAYRARCELVDERTGDEKNYAHRAADVVFQGIFAPAKSPDWTRDRQQLWNHVEAFEKHQAAQLAREFEIALPHELDVTQARYALQDWIKENFTRQGLIADAVIHQPSADRDERNLHAHVMVVMRPLDGTEFRAKKERKTRDEHKADLRQLRESWAHHANRHLERHGHDARIDSRSLAEQGLAADPTIHLGWKASEMERRGRASELGEINRKIIAGNARRAQEAANQNTPAPMLTAERIAAAEQRQELRDGLRQDEEISLALHQLSRTDQAAAAIFVRPAQTLQRNADPHGLAMQFARDLADQAQALTPTITADEHAAAKAAYQERERAREAAAQQASRARSWMAQAGGYEALSPELQDSARTSFAKWQARDPDKAARFDLARYVDFVQAQEAKRAQAKDMASLALEQAQEPQRETQPPVAKGPGRGKAGVSPEATQRPSYEVANRIPTPEPAQTREKTAKVAPAPDNFWAGAGAREKAAQEAAKEAESVRRASTAVKVPEPAQGPENRLWPQFRLWLVRWFVGHVVEWCRDMLGLPRDPTPVPQLVTPDQTPERAHGPEMRPNARPKPRTLDELLQAGERLMDEHEAAMTPAQREEARRRRMDEGRERLREMLPDPNNSNPRKPRP